MNNPLRKTGFHVPFSKFHIHFLMDLSAETWTVTTVKMYAFLQRSLPSKGRVFRATVFLLEGTIYEEGIGSKWFCNSCVHRGRARGACSGGQIEAAESTGNRKV